jgi:hypothetical protein
MPSLRTESGAVIIDALESKPWGAREFAVQTSDGHVLRIGHGEKRIDEISNFTLGSTSSRCA